MSEPIKAILIGAGNRGADSYAPYALRHPDQLRFIAVAEPDPVRRKRFAEMHNIEGMYQFKTWEPLLEQPKIADAVLVTTQDQQHTGPALAALRAGYDVLLEKPMAPSAEECRHLVRTAGESGRQLHVCHVLRYTPHFQKMREVILSGVLGDVINVSHRENVSWWHMAHSFVRGNWCNSDRGTPMILAKCVHDFDILIWVLGQKCEWLSSAGSLLHFRPENAPPGAPNYCLDGCPAAEECPYFAPFIYRDLIPLWRSFSETAEGFSRIVTRLHLRSPKLISMVSQILPLLKQVSDYEGWPRTVVANEPGDESVMAALKRGPYGRCVYHSDNDVVDNQIVAMQFEGGPTITHTMHGHSHVEYRTTRIEGTRGTLQAQFGLGGSWIEVDEHRSDRHTHYNTSAAPGDGHGGGDEKLMAAFVESLTSGGKNARTLASQALESHLMAFAAEEARLSRRVVHMDDFRKG